MSETKELSFPMVLRHELEGKRAEIMAALAGKIDVDRFIMVALTAATKNKALESCSIASIFLAIMESARAGLMPDNKEAALIPYGGHAEFMPMVQGIVNLILRSPGVLKVEARPVYEGDVFELEYGLRPKLVHIPRFTSDVLTHAYAIIWRQATEPTFEVMDRDEIEQARLTSRAPNSPAWKDWYSEMARKVVTKRISKYVDLSPEASRAIAIDNAVSGHPWGSEYVDGPSDEYRNLLVKNQTLVGIASLKEKMGKEQERPDLDSDAIQIQRDQDEKPVQGERPHAPEVVKAMILEHVDEFKGTRRDSKVGKNEIWQLAAWQLNECFPGPGQDDRRHSVLAYLIGKDSIQDATGAECRAIVAWLAPMKNKRGDLVPNALSAQEARLILRARMKELGQEELAL